MADDFSDIHPLRWKRTRPFAKEVLRIVNEGFVPADLAEPDEKGRVWVGDLVESCIYDAADRAGFELTRTNALLREEVGLSLSVAKFFDGNSNVVVIDQLLFELLVQTEGEGIPLSAILPTHPFLFLSLPRGNGFSFPGEPNEIDGAYIEWNDGLLLTITSRLTRRKVSLQTWPAPVEQTEIGVESDDRSGTVESLLEDYHTDNKGWLRPVLSAIFNALAYLSTKPSAEAAWSRDLPLKIAKKLAVGTAKQKRVARDEVRRAGVLPITIVGRDVAAALAASATQTGRTVATHWRRGHFHTYKVGIGRQETLLKWVAPTIINADRGTPNRLHIHPVKLD